MTNTPATFHALMNSIFADLIAAGKMAVYMNDLLIYAANLIQLCKVTREVLARLMQYDLYLKPEKCELEYLGMIIRQGEVRMDPNKVAVVRNWPTPTLLREVRAFLGLAISTGGLYRTFQVLHILFMTSQKRICHGNGRKNSKRCSIHSKKVFAGNQFLRSMTQNSLQEWKLMHQDL